jgi:hypothetical protein
VAGAGECGDEPSGCIKCGEFLVAEDLLGFQEGPVPWSSVQFSFTNSFSELQRTRSSIPTPA